MGDVHIATVDFAVGWTPTEWLVMTAGWSGFLRSRPPVPLGPDDMLGEGMAFVSMQATTSWIP